ncbi:MAG: hypothetical protein ACI9WS_000567 [Paraglaciecola psychrophila]|jgi:hypothetical protein
MTQHSRNIDERRHYYRYPTSELKVLIKSMRSQDSDWIKGMIRSVDFSRYGIGLETEHCFAIGDHVSLVIRTDDSTLTEITGIISNRTKQDQGFRCGIRFHVDIKDDELDFLEEQISTVFH